jgi:thiamine biosynthesis lipoprotein
MLHQRHFTCMTTEIALFLDCDDDAAADKVLSTTEAFVRSVETRFSRFLETSELSRLNRSAGSPDGIRVSTDLSRLLRMAQADRARTLGIFDPTILPALEAAGYDRSIEFLGKDFKPSRECPTKRNTVPLSLDRNDVVHLPAGAKIDLGGIAKGWAVDQAAARLLNLGAGMVDAGGDIRAWGEQPGAGQGEGWLVAIENPLAPDQDTAWLHVRDGAVATSSVVKRSWRGGHHLIDPRTGRPALTDLVAVTATAATAHEAEIAAKTLLILGEADGTQWLATQPGVEALWADRNGIVRMTPKFADDLVPAELTA